MAARSFGTILTSADGVTWTARVSGTAVDLKSITYGNNVFIAVGYSIVGDSTVVYAASDDATWTWTSVNFDEGNYIDSISCGVNKFIIAGFYYDATYDYWEDMIWSSADGKKWDVSRIADEVLWLNSITYINNKFFAIGEYEDWIFYEIPPATIVYTSVDGINWGYHTYDLADYPDIMGMTDIAYGNNQYVAVGNNGKVLSSPDGINWQNNTPKDYWAVAYGSENFVSVGMNGTIVSSSNGNQWRKRVSGTSAHLYGVVYGGNKFVAVGDNGIVLTSPDGNKWNKLSDVSDSTFYDITYGSSLFVAVRWVRGYVSQLFLLYNQRYYHIWRRDQLGCGA